MEIYVAATIQTMVLDSESDAPYIPLPHLSASGKLLGNADFPIVMIKPFAKLHDNKEEFLAWVAAAASDLWDGRQRRVVNDQSHVLKHMFSVKGSEVITTTKELLGKRITNIAKLVQVGTQLLIRNIGEKEPVKDLLPNQVLVIVDDDGIVRYARSYGGIENQAKSI